MHVESFAQIVAVFLSLCTRNLQVSHLNLKAGKVVTLLSGRNGVRNLKSISATTGRASESSSSGERMTKKWLL